LESHISSLFWLDILQGGQLPTFCPLFRPQSGQQKWLIYAVFEGNWPDGQIFFYLFKKKYNNIYKVRKKSGHLASKTFSAKNKRASNKTLNYCLN